MKSIKKITMVSVVAGFSLASLTGTVFAQDDEKCANAEKDYNKCMNKEWKGRTGYDTQHDYCHNWADLTTYCD